MGITLFSYRSCLLSWQERWPFFFTDAQLQALKESNLSDHHLRLMIFDILSRIPAQLNPNKPIKKMYTDAWPAMEALLKNKASTAAQLERPLKNLLAPLFIYSNACLRACGNNDGTNTKAAHEKFMADLCVPTATVPPATSALWDLPEKTLMATKARLMRLPEYQASSVMLSVLQTPKIEPYAYAAKTILTAFLFYLELGASRYSANQLLNITRYTIDSSSLTHNRMINTFMQNILETLLPYAMMLGAHAVHERATLAKLIKKFIQYFPAYQLSHFLLQHIRHAVANSRFNKYSVINHPDSDKYGYSEGAKLILTAALFYMEMGTSSYVPCSLLMMAKQNIDCSQLTRSATFNHVLHMSLQIILPYAAMLGMYFAASDGGDFASIAGYAAMSYGFLSTLDWTMGFLYKKVMSPTPANNPGPTRQIAAYLGQQSVHFTASALFHYLVPPQPWLSAHTPEVKPPCAENIPARNNAARVLGLDVSANNKEIHARVRQLSHAQYTRGSPKDHDKMMEINNAKDCLLEYRDYEGNKFTA